MRTEWAAPGVNRYPSTRSNTYRPRVAVLAEAEAVEVAVVADDRDVLLVRRGVGAQTTFWCPGTAETLAVTPGASVSHYADVELFETWPRRGYRGDASIYEGLQDVSRRIVFVQLYPVTTVGVRVIKKRGQTVARPHFVP